MLLTCCLYCVVASVTRAMLSQDTIILTYNNPLRFTVHVKTSNQGWEPLPSATSAPRATAAPPRQEPASPPEKPPQVDRRPYCDYGTKCYRENAEHKRKYRHDRSPRRHQSRRQKRRARPAATAGSDNDGHAPPPASTGKAASISRYFQTNGDGSSATSKPDVATPVRAGTRRATSKPYHLLLLPVLSEAGDGSVGGRWALALRTVLQRPCRMPRDT